MYQVPTSSSLSPSTSGVVISDVPTGACAAPPPVNPGYVNTHLASQGTVSASVQGGLADTIPDAPIAFAGHADVPVISYLLPQISWT